ncbi:MAG: DUF1365 domain-containing protein [Acidobacteriota bacterium]
MASRSALLTGHVMHRRLGSVAHGFRYRAAMVRLDLDELGALGRRLRLLGINRRGLVAFHEADHLDAAPGALRGRVADLLVAHGILTPVARVELVTLCRMLGYVFNPVSFFFCYGADGYLAGIVCEVNNTFGERHAYVLPGGGSAGVWQAKKVFHVSPFYSLDGSYRFAFDLADEHVDVRIDLLRAGVPVFVSRLSLDARPLTDRAVARMLLWYPLATVTVIAAIHWEALRLWWKGAAYHPKPDYDPDAARHTEA